jgi:hypothetical protein
MIILCDEAVIMPSYDVSRVKIDINNLVEIDLRRDYQGTGLQDIINCLGEGEILEAIGKERVKEYFDLVETD